MKKIINALLMLAAENQFGFSQATDSVKKAADFKHTKMQLNKIKNIS